ncbi:hypothetical protein ACOBQX_26240 [Actinokineospora sp. G85]|uniref:hypothetical protein n=1 Tax=Actinokineospora sp. G85 TaxID=3406626 RepID=UPI003C770FA4
MGFVSRAVRLGSASAVAGIAAAVLAVPAAASSPASEWVCNSAHSLCNWTEGSGAYVNYVQGQRAQDLVGLGFYEVFGPGGYKKTDITTTTTTRDITIGRSFATGSLICLRFFKKNSNGSFTQKGGNVCTSVPIS